MTRCLLAPAIAVLLSLTAIADDAKSDAPRTVSRRGPVEATLEVEPANPRLGDPITLALSVRSEPGVEVLLPEFFESLGRFEVREYRATDEVDDEGRNVAVRRCEIVPPRSGDHSIPPLLVEFLDRRPGRDLKPEGEPAYELLTERLAFEVEPIAEQDINAAFEDPYGELAPLPEPEERDVVLPILLLVGGTVAAYIALRIFRTWQRLARRRSAYDIALGRLERLQTRGVPTKDDEIDLYYVELTQILRRYLEDRFSLRASDRTTEEFIEGAASASSLDPEQQGRLRDVLASADLVKFAHRMPTDSEIRASLDQVRAFLEETRENAPLLDVDGERSSS